MALTISDARLVGIAAGFRQKQPEARQLKVALTFDVPWREKLMRYTYQWQEARAVFGDRPTLTINRTRWKLFGADIKSERMSIRIEYEDGPVPGMLSVWHHLGRVGVLTLRAEAAA